MAVDEDLAERMRAALAGAGEVREVRMFGGLCFMLDGNVVAGTSKRGLLVRVGKDRQPDALARPGAKPMEMGGRRMEGYVFVDPGSARRGAPDPPNLADCASPIRPARFFSVTSVSPWCNFPDSGGPKAAVILFRCYSIVRSIEIR